MGWPIAASRSTRHFRLAVLLWCAAAPSTGTDRGGLEEALARPLSPGSIAMLLDFAKEPKVQERWAAALRDEGAESRAAAARVIGVAAAATLQPDILSALQKEEDGDAARELMRTAAALGGSDEALFATAARLRGAGVGDPGVEVLAEILGRRWSSRDRTFTWPPPSHTRGPFVTASTPAGSGPKGAAEGRQALTRIGTIALREKNPELLDLVLDVSIATGTDIDPGTLQAALQTAREDTCWYLARMEPRRLPLLLLEAATAADDIPFACEIVARLAGRPLDRTPPSRDWTSPTGRKSAKRVFLDPLIVEALTPAERKELSLALGGEEQALDKSLALRQDVTKRSASPLPGVVDPTAPSSISLLYLASFPRGYVKDVLGATGCRKAPPDAWGGAEITYKDDGRPQNVVSFDMNRALESCQGAARLLFMTALAPGDRVIRRGEVHVAFVRLDPDSVSCALTSVDPAAKRTGSAIGMVVPVGGKIAEPKKTKNVPPVYPASARQRRVQGVVILEAVIMPSGCVGGLTVVRHVDAALDMSALRAVAEWRYTPTLLNGIAVPVIMTVTVNFRLN